MLLLMSKCQLPSMMQSWCIKDVISYDSIIYDEMKRFEIRACYVSSLIVLLSSIMELSCTSEKNFQGELEYFEDHADETELQSHPIRLSNTFTPLVNIVDSKALCFNVTRGDFAFEIVDIRKGQILGDFCPIGHGHNEFLSLLPIQQIYQVGDEWKTMLFAPNESRMVTWNITESIKKQQTVYEHVVPYSWKDKSPVSYSKQVVISDDTLLLYTPSVSTFPNDMVTDPIYQTRTLGTNEPIREIRVFAHCIDGKDSKVLPENLLDASFSLKPDRKKFVEAMNWLPQINIVDISSGRVSGFRMKNTQDEDVFETDMDCALFCYKRVVSDDRYIYALWSGCARNELSADIAFDMVHVFDWNGKLVRKLKLDCPVSDLVMDFHDGSLYGWNMEEQILYKYDMGFRSSKNPL